MTPTRAQEFAATWNGGDAARVASTFAEDGVTHASFGPEPLGASFVGRAEIERGRASVAGWCPSGGSQPCASPRSKARLVWKR